MQSAIFDLDGTVLDTLGDIAAACNEMLARHGYPQHPVSAYRQMVGNGFDRLVSRAVPAERMPGACELADLAAEARKTYSQRMMESTEPYPGIPEALQTLKERGFKLGLLSNKPDEMTQALIRHYFPNVFDAIQGALPDIPLKPDPQSLLAMQGKFGTIQNAYIGDSNVDMLTARNARTLAVGVAWGFRGPEELEASGAAIIADTPEELANLTIPAI